MSTNPTVPGQPRRVGLFVTCLVDMFRAGIGFATLKLLREAGFTVDVPASQTCCGQPAYNSGDVPDAAALARQVIAAFDEVAAVVVPSGSCAGMIRVHYPKILADDEVWREKAAALAAKTYELSEFLAKHDVSIAAACADVATYHDSCSCLREVGVMAEPRALLSQVDGLELRELAGTQECCGFGGLFALKYGDISERMADAKLKAAMDTGATTLVAADLGCLLALEGRAKRTGVPLHFRHIAEILAEKGKEKP